jgi:hypothetical protein
MGGLQERADEVRRLAKSDPDPRVRRRAQAVFLLAQGESVQAVARCGTTVPHRVRAWRGWFLEGGRDRVVLASVLGTAQVRGDDLTGACFPFLVPGLPLAHTM